MNPLLAFALIGAGSWLLRIAFLVVVPLERLPSGLAAGLDLLAPSVLGAIVAVDLAATLTAGATLAGAGLTLALTAGIGYLAWRTRNLALVAVLALAAVALIDLVPA
jgi:branched-subunit amino acid transport protein